MAASPGFSAVRLTMLPETLTVATSISLESASYVKGSPSGSLKYCATSTLTPSPRARVSAGIACVGICPEVLGARFVVSAGVGATEVEDPSPHATRTRLSITATQTVRVIGPAFQECEIELIPVWLHRLTVGLTPTMPLHEEGA